MKLTNTEIQNIFMNFRDLHDIIYLDKNPKDTTNVTQLLSRLKKKIFELLWCRV